MRFVIRDPKKGIVGRMIEARTSSDNMRNDTDTRRRSS